ncbi:hypothetical protein AAY473_025045 [Plecturocebus cupreus]
MKKPVSTKNTNISRAWWHMPVIPATWEAEAGELLEPGRRRRRWWWAEIVPLHSSLGNKRKTPYQKKFFFTVVQTLNHDEASCGSLQLQERKLLSPEQPVSLHLGRLRQEDHLSPGVRHQPEEHSETLSLLKINKISQLLGRLRQEDCLSPGDGGCSEPCLRHYTPAWATDINRMAPPPAVLAKKARTHAVASPFPPPQPSWESPGHFLGTPCPGPGGCLLRFPVTLPVGAPVSSPDWELKFELSRLLQFSAPTFLALAVGLKGEWRTLDPGTASPGPALAHSPIEAGPNWLLEVGGQTWGDAGWQKPRQVIVSEDVQDCYFAISTVCLLKTALMLLPCAWRVLLVVAPFTLGSSVNTREVLT